MKITDIRSPEDVATFLAAVGQVPGCQVKHSAKDEILPMFSLAAKQLDEMIREISGLTDDL